MGPKAAEKMALWLLKNPSRLARTIQETQKIKPCAKCRSLVCFCNSSKRDSSQLCIIEDDADLAAIERSGHYNGLYYVIDQEGKIKINNKIKEIIIATNPTTEGDLLALKIKKALARRKGLKITRLARGLSSGADIEYADEKTLEAALKNRQKL